MKLDDEVKDNNDSGMMNDMKIEDNNRVKIGLLKWQRGGRVMIEFKKEYVWVEDALESLSIKTATSAAEFQLVIETIAAILIAPKDVPIIGVMLNLGKPADEARICYCTTNDVMVCVRTINLEATKAIKLACEDKITTYFVDPPIKCHSAQGKGEINILTRLVAYTTCIFL